MVAWRPYLFLFALYYAAAITGSAQTTYSKTCPLVEQIVRETLIDKFNQDKTVPAGLLRLHFHDCFVEGCDGSVLLDSTPTDGTDVEKFSLANNNSVRGFDVIDDVKTKLEAACPGVVSCADIVALAARDAVVFLGAPYYRVPTGRLDGRSSNRTLADLRLPSPFMNFSALKNNFAQKGLRVQDLVLLSGGHTIGRSKCRFFEDPRIYNFNNTGKADPRLNSKYLAQLRGVCRPRGANPSPTEELDKDSEFVFDNFYYRNLVNGNALLASDQELISSSESASLVRSLARNQGQFFGLYIQSIIKMGNLEWKKPNNGEIRIKCNVVNSRKISDVVSQDTGFESS